MKNEYLRMMSPVVVALLFPFLMAGCKQDERLRPNERFISQQQNPNTWPFTVPSGILRCSANPKSPIFPAVTFTPTGGITYGLNGGALTGYVYPSVDPIMMKTDIGLYKVGLGEPIEEGLKLCEMLPPDERPALSND